MHPTDRRLTGIYGTIWFDDLGDTTGQVHQCNVTVAAPRRSDAQRGPGGPDQGAGVPVRRADAGHGVRHARRDPDRPRTGGHAVRIIGSPTAQSRLEASADGLVATPWFR